MGIVGAVGILLFGVGTSYVGGLVGTIVIILDVVGYLCVTVETLLFGVWILLRPS